MASQETGGPDGPETRREQLTARREAQRRQRAKGQRRLIGVVGAAIAVGVVAAIALSAGGGSGSGRRSNRLATAKAAGGATAGKPPTAGEAAGLVRNATPQPDWQPDTGPVPILEYHVLGAAPADAPYPELYVTRPDFHRQMDWLDQHGFEAVTLEAVEQAWYHGGTLPAKPVVISFDDGYRPQFTSRCRSCASTAGPASSTSRRKAPTSTKATSRR